MRVRAARFGKSFPKSNKRGWSHWELEAEKRVHGKEGKAKELNIHIERAIDTSSFDDVIVT